MKMPTWVWRLVEHFRVVLPVLVVAALAAYTWWLVQAMPDTSIKNQITKPHDLPDYVLKQARVERIDASGQPVALLQGRMMVYHAEQDRLDITSLHLIAKKSNGDKEASTLQAWANDGRYEGKTGDIHLLGQVRVMSSGMFKGEQLLWQPRLQLLSTDQPVVLQSPQGTLQGMRLRHNTNTGVTQLSGRVTGVLQAKSALNMAQ